MSLLDTVTKSVGDVFNKATTDNNTPKASQIFGMEGDDWDIPKLSSLFYVEFEYTSIVDELFEYLTFVDYSKTENLNVEYIEENMRKSSLWDTVKNKVNAAYSSIKDTITSTFSTENTDQTTETGISAFFTRLKDEKNNVSEWVLKVKDCDRPGFQIKNEKFNAYNRKVLRPVETIYNPVSMTFYDTIHGDMLKLIIAYATLINYDFHLKNENGIYKYDSYPGFGLSTYSGLNIFKRINIYEFYGNKVTIYNLNNPRLADINFSKADKTAQTDSTFTLKFDYEYLTYFDPHNEFGNNEPVIGGEMNKEIAALVHMRYMNLANRALSWGLNALKDYKRNGKFDWKNGLKSAASVVGMGSQAKAAINIVDAGKAGLKNPKAMFSTVTGGNKASGQMLKALKQFKG